MNYRLASSLARARHDHLLRESAERRRLAILRPARPYVRRFVGAALVRFGRASVALGEAIAWPA